MSSRIFKFPTTTTEVIVKKYRRFNLEGNPFPMQGLASRETPFVPYPKEVIERINCFVTDSIDSKGYHGLPLVGDYGSGKTRLLFAIEKEITETVMGCNAIYIDEPPADIQLFYMRILNKINLGK